MKDDGFDDSDWEETDELDNQSDKRITTGKTRTQYRDKDGVRKPKTRKIKRRMRYMPNSKSLREAIFTNGHAMMALDLLREGYFDYEIAAQFGIHPDTIGRWKNQHPDFKAAWDIGEPACMAFWSIRLREMALTGDEAGFKSTMCILNNRFRAHFGVGTNTGGANSVQNTVNIQNMNTVNLIDKLSTDDIVSRINAQIGKFKALNILDASFKEVSSSEVPSELTSDQDKLNE